MGGGEGDEDLGDDSVASESAQPGQIEVAAPDAPEPAADPAAPEAKQPGLRPGHRSLALPRRAERH